MGTGQMTLRATVSVADAAQRLGVSEKTVRRWIKAGKLPAAQEAGPYGMAWRIPETAIQTAQQVVEVLTVERPVDPRVLGQVVAQAVAQETRALDETVAALTRQVAALEQTIERLAARQAQAGVDRDAQVVQMMREVLGADGARTPPWWRWWRRS